MTLCISDVDCEWIASKTKGASAEVLAAGISFERFGHVPVSGLPLRSQVGFVGGLEWSPNEVGLRWFVDEVFPRILKQAPCTRLAVLARGAYERSWLRDQPHIDILPAATTPVGLFAESRVSIAPLLEGGGVRIKILESLSVGCPVVATSIGGEGLRLPGLTKTDDPSEFADACVRQLSASNDVSRSHARAGVAAKHGADAVARRLVDIWRQVTHGGSTATARI